MHIEAWPVRKGGGDKTEEVQWNVLVERFLHLWLQIRIHLFNILYNWGNNNYSMTSDRAMKLYFLYESSCLFNMSHVWCSHKNHSWKYITRDRDWAKKSCRRLRLVSAIDNWLTRNISRKTIKSQQTGEWKSSTSDNKKHKTTTTRMKMIITTTTKKRTMIRRRTTTMQKKNTRNINGTYLRWHKK